VKLRLAEKRGKVAILERRSLDWAYDVSATQALSLAAATLSRHYHDASLLIIEWQQSSSITPEYLSQDLRCPHRAQQFKFKNGNKKPG